MKKYVLLTLMALTLGLTSACSSNSAPSVPPATPAKTENSDTNPPDPVTVKTTASIAAVGDVLIHSSLYKDAKTADGYDFRYMFELVKPYISQADLAIANQETMIGGVEIGLSDYPMFNSPQEVGDALQDTGFHVVSLANNHTLDAGERGILRAIEHWNKLGLTYVGANESWEDRERIRTLERNGITFSILSYTYGTNGIPVPSGKEYLVNLIEPERMKQDIYKAKQISDVVIMNLHHGGEYERMPNAEQKNLVREMTNAGVDLVLGHHPHVLQPVEWIENEDGRRSFVIHSLGNFISGQDQIYREIGGILQIEVEKTQTGDLTTVQLKEPAFLPVWTHKRNWRQYKIIPLQEVTPQQLPSAPQLYDEITEHMKIWVPELKALPLTTP